MKTSTLRWLEPNESIKVENKGTPSGDQIAERVTSKWLDKVAPTYVIGFGGNSPRFISQTAAASMVVSWGSLDSRNPFFSSHSFRAPHDQYIIFYSSMLSIDRLRSIDTGPDRRHAELAFDCGGELVGWLAIKATTTAHSNWLVATAKTKSLIATRIGGQSIAYDASLICQFFFFLWLLLLNAKSAKVFFTKRIPIVSAKIINYTCCLLWGRSNDRRWPLSRTECNSMGSQLNVI